MTQNKEMIEFYGVKYIMLSGFEFLDKSINEYPSFCGAGDGIGDKIVPERIGGMRCSHICHGHDDWWERCSPTWKAFAASNASFLYNLLIYLVGGPGGVWIRIKRVSIGCFYAAAVATVGWKIFKRIKGI